MPSHDRLEFCQSIRYLSTNNKDRRGTSTVDDDVWVSSTVVRYNLDQLVDCAPRVSFDTFTDDTAPQRVYVPVESATDRIYWGALDNSTTFRIYEWQETSTSVTSTTRRITTSPHNNPDCRGGMNNTDWRERSTDFSMTGFSMRGWYGQPERGGGRDVIGFLWNVGTDAAHPQGHIHGAVFDANTKNLVSEPHIFNPDFCFGYPDVAPTGRGHPAVIVADGGRSGGGGHAISNTVFVGDDTVTTGGPFGPGITIAVGTHNPAASGPNALRYGDYLTIQRHEPCRNFLVASGYVYRDGSEVGNTEHHYVQFGRQRDRPCWDNRHLQP